MCELSLFVKVSAGSRVLDVENPDSLIRVYLHGRLDLVIQTLEFKNWVEVVAAR